jgi:uncharacterized protein DUF4956
MGFLFAQDTASTNIALNELFENLRFLDIRIINVADTLELLLRFAFNALVLGLIVWKIYNKRGNSKQFALSFMAIGATVFLLTFLLNSVKLQLGFALGLFAVFGIIRYRTDTIPIKEMTYLFVIIGVSVINALANKKVSYVELILTNSAIFFGLFWLEKALNPRREHSMLMRYEKIELIHKKDETALLQDIRERTGIKVTRYTVEKIDYLRDIADMTLYYYEDDSTYMKKENN